MSDFRDNILSRAFQVVPGVEFNRTRRELLERAVIEGVELMKALRDLEGLNHEAMHFRVLRWLAQTEPAVPAS